MPIPITCLGKTFATEDERRSYFRDELRKQLPELRKIEGFPIGTDDDILNLSDPPYYTACPNPWLNDFIAQWEEEKKELEKNNKRKVDFEVHEPYASDVSEGKNNPIYNAHSYHTKVPHPAIMRYILHYTQPGDIVFDGFAGTGMTGVAAFFCGSPENVLKYRIESEWMRMYGETPIWGRRNSICSDLSPIACFIAYNYNTPVFLEEYKTKANSALEEVISECGWMFETKHTNNLLGNINYVVWSDVFLCSNCGRDFIYWDAAIDKSIGIVKDEFECPHCLNLLTKRTASKAKSTNFDIDLNKSISQTKTVPVFINYSYRGKRYEKIPDDYDLKLIKKISDIKIPYWYPTDEVFKGDKTGEPIREGITNAHHFYTKRNLYILSALWYRLENKMKWSATSFLSRNLTKTNRFIINKHNPNGRINGPLTGTWYIPSEYVEQSSIRLFKDKFIKAGWNISGNCIQNQSTTCLPNLKDNSIDYLFTDPPFGANIMYSELNFLWESWLKIKTDNTKEVIENNTQRKSTLDYQNLMTECFRQYYRILKSGKWMTVEFSNTSAAVWNGLQTALQRAGFVIANVTVLDKQHGGIKAMRYTTSVKEDLVISCYKPSEKILAVINDSNNGIIKVDDFLQEHLGNLSVHIPIGDKTISNIERNPKILYDRLISFYILRGYPIPLDAREFQDHLKQKYIERDGMYFLKDQAAIYEEKKSKLPQLEQMPLIVTNESEGLEWLKTELSTSSYTYQELRPKWMQAITAVRKGDLLPELKEILKENFIEIANGKWRVPDMNEAKDREHFRTTALLKEFGKYIDELANPKTKKLKDVRVEALHAGFKSCWEKKEFNTIVNLAEKIPQNLLMEDEQLLMFYDIAKDKS